jgi:dienelactone hydrolase
MSPTSTSCAAPSKQPAERAFDVRPRQPIIERVHRSQPRAVVLGAAACLSLVLTAGTACAGNAKKATVAIEVDQPRALADQPVHVRVTGLTKSENVTLNASAISAAAQTWRSSANFVADDKGVVDLATAVPTSGSYAGADAMGLFWSLGLPPGQDDDKYFVPRTPQEQSAYPITLTVTADGKPLATTTVSREWMAGGEQAKTLTVATDEVNGVLFTPASTTKKHPAVLVFGGAEGGMQQVFTAALLAAHGYPALTVAYFGSEGLPQQLKDIPLEYFKKAGEILLPSAGVDPEHVLVMGYSRGTEAALLLANDFPDLFHGAVLYSPSALVNPASTGPDDAAWTLGGQPVGQFTIPVDHVAGPVYAIAGGSDALWTSADWAEQIVDELTTAHNRYPHQLLGYDDAGHGVGTFPYAPIGGTALIKLGGRAAGDMHSQRDSWTKVLALLASLTGARAGAAGSTAPAPSAARS